MEYLCSDVILGQTFQKLHNRLVIEYGLSKNDLIILKPKVCTLTEALISKDTLFPNLPAKCRPIAVKSRNYSEADRTLIRDEIQKLLKDGIIGASRLPWRAQVVVVRTDTKTRMCVDYSQTINLYTSLDAYQFPRIDEMV